MNSNRLFCISIFRLAVSALFALLTQSMFSNLANGGRLPKPTRFKNMGRGCVVLDQPLHEVESFLIRLISPAAAGLRHSRGPFSKQALSALTKESAKAKVRNPLLLNILGATLAFVFAEQAQTLNRA
jgi:hypothetical protein